MSKAIKLAVVDDQHLFRKGILSMLKDFPELNVVIEAKDGADLLEQLKKKTAEVILLDLEMPNMNGFEATELVSARYPDSKIIILTTHNEESFIYHLIRKGARGFILKDADIEI